MTANLQAFFDEVAELPWFSAISPIGLHSRDPCGTTLLHVAAGRGDIAMMSALLDAGAEIQLPGEYGYIPLHDAAESGHLDAVRQLLARGACPSFTTGDGSTPSDLVDALNHPEISRLLNEHVAQPAARSQPRDDATPSNRSLSSRGG